MLLPPINGATASSGTSYFTENPGDKFFAWDYSATVDYMPIQFLTWRVEYNHREASVPYFAARVVSRHPAGIKGPPAVSSPAAFRP